MSRICRKQKGKCLSTEYINNITKLEWECKEKHTWFASPNNMLNKNQWCSRCSSGKTQKLLMKILGEVFNQPKIYYNHKDFDWLKYKQQQEIDIWIPKLKLAIEYDGEQHFGPVQFGGISMEKAKENYKNQKKLDANKNKLIKQHKSEIKYFIRFPYTMKITEENIIKILTEYNIPLPKGE